VVSAGPASRAAYAYNPKSNRWRRLASMPSARQGASVAWVGKRLLVFGGEGSNARIAALGLAYDPQVDRWSSLPAAPMVPRAAPIVLGAGRSLIAWGGVIPAGTSTPTTYPRDGAVFTPRP
jgi:N-acetylneuraminic acid mutarotase